MAVDPNLAKVLQVIRPEVQVPIILETVDASGETRKREVADLGLNPTYSGKFVNQVHALLPPDQLDKLVKSRAVTNVWLDNPVYALPTGYLSVQGPFTIPPRSALIGLDDVGLYTRSRELQDAGANGKGVTIAILDTGVNGNHPMLDGQVTNHLSMVQEPPGQDLQGHGTWCASAIVGKPTEYQGKVTELQGRVLIGRAPEARLLDIKVLTGEGTGSTSGVIQGIEAAIQANVRIISMSLGSLIGGAGRTPDSAIVNEATKRGIACVIAAGNSFGYLTVGSPGSASGAITVGSVAVKTPNPSTVSSFSSKGPTSDLRIKPDISAPGGNVRPFEMILGATSGQIEAHAGEPYGLLAGTSMATPTVAGILAQLAPLGLPTDRGEIEYLLATGTRTPTPVPSVKNNRTGWGPIDAVKMLKSISHKPTIPRRSLQLLAQTRSRPILGGIMQTALNLHKQTQKPEEVRLPLL